MGAEIRKCYSDPIECKVEVLGWMMAQDAVFILELIDCYKQSRNPSFQQESPSDIVQNQTWANIEIRTV